MLKHLVPLNVAEDMFYWLKMSDIQVYKFSCFFILYVVQICVV